MLSNEEMRIDDLDQRQQKN